MIDLTALSNEELNRAVAEILLEWRVIPERDVRQATGCLYQAPDGSLWPSGAWTAAIEEAWPLVERYALSIMPSLYPERGAWWVGRQAERGAFAATFADIPRAICEAALYLK